MAAMNAFKRLWQPVYQSHRGISIAICRITVVAMMGCLGFGFARMVQRVTQEIGQTLNSDYLMIFAIIVSAEAMYTQRRSADLDGKDKWIFRAAEGLTLVILFKLFVLLRGGLAAMAAEVSRWQSDFSNAFFTGEFIAGGIILIFVWGLTTYLTAEIDDLHDREQDAAWDELGKVQNALHLIRARIMSAVFATGAFVLLCAVGARLNLRSFIPVLSDRFDPSVPIANVLIYFVLTLVLLSQTQFALLRTRWIWSKTPIAPNLARNWLTFGVVFFVALAMLSFILPTNYSMGFFETLGYMLNILGNIFRLIITLILLPFTLCAKLFNVATPPTQEEAPAATPPPLPPAVDGSPSALWQFIQSLLFWGTLLAVVIFALSQYIRANAFLLRRLAQLPFMNWFLNIIRGLWSWLRGANRTVVSLIGAGLRRLRPPTSPFQRLERILRRPGGRTPREQVIELYLALIELGRKIGPARGDGETPYQYSRDMIGAHPTVTNEVLDLTEAFNEARYSDHPVQPDSIHPLRSKWDRIRDQLEKDETIDSSQIGPSEGASPGLNP
jgi:hypothetical protein